MLGCRCQHEWCCGVFPSNAGQDWQGTIVRLEPREIFCKTNSSSHQWMKSNYRNSSSDLWSKDVQKLQGFSFTWWIQFWRAENILAKCVSLPFTLQYMYPICTHVAWKTKKVYIGLSPCPVIVTTRIITCLGDSLSPGILGRGTTQGI